MRSSAFIGALAIITVMGCNTFITRPEQDSLQELEKGLYVLKSDVSVEGRSFKKGDEIRLIIARTEGWIKVNGYKAGQDRLKAETVLILYLFKDEFEKKRFNRGLFDQRLADVVKPIAERERDEQKGKRQPARKSGR